MAAIAPEPYAFSKRLEKVDASPDRMLLMPFGRPTARICRSRTGFRIAYHGENTMAEACFRIAKTNITEDTRFPSTVASAAPATPILKERINSGSSSRLVTVPAILLIMPGRMIPSARIVEAMEMLKSISGEPSARMRM